MTPIEQAREPPLPPLARSRAEPADPVGAATLERLAVASNYNRWLFDRVSRWVGARVLEIGAGVGNMSAFVADRERVVLSDCDAYYLARLRERFAGRPNIAVTALQLPTTDAALVAERFDTIICLNVLEHVEDDRASLAAMRRLLQPKGRLVLLVPALRGIYGALDEALGHVRRYGRAELASKCEETGFRLRHLEYFNLAGIPGWWFAGRVLKRRLIPAGSLR
ncbi:MAG: class I SAM-dependent methyltransferase, partial [Gemmatimonadales bacterium]